MNEIFENKIFKYLPIVLIFLLAFILRFYNLNGEDFWTDEMFAYWTTDPNISFKDTVVRTLSSNFNSLFDFLLKSFHTVFGYNVHTSRYFVLFFSLVSLILFAYLLDNTSSYKSLIFGFFLLSINIFHIKYSQELRSYIITFLLALIFIILNFKNGKIENNLSYKKILTITFLSILMVLNHSFSILILLSLILFKLLSFFKTKKITIKEVFLIISLSIVILLYLFVYLPININYSEYFETSLAPHWIKPTDLSFFTNFYFSSFFGSRILGLIYLLSLIYLIFKNRNKIFFELNIFTFFVILILLSYFLPVVYGYIFAPVLTSRYVIFLLIPIIFIISHFIFLDKNKFIKISLIFLIVVVTSFNHVLYENSFKQFYKEVYPTKPQIKRSLEIINKSNTNIYSIKKFEAKEKNLNEVYKNYIKNYIKKLNFDLINLDDRNDYNNINSFWIIYISDVRSNTFEKPKKLDNVFKIEKIIELNSLSLIKLKKSY